MKFNVTHNSLGTYDVRLHWESKAKIKKIAAWGFAAAAVVVVTRNYVDTLNNLPDLPQ